MFNDPTHDVALRQKLQPFRRTQHFDASNARPYEDQNISNSAIEHLLKDAGYDLEKIDRHCDKACGTFHNAWLLTKTMPFRSHPPRKK